MCLVWKMWSSRKCILLMLVFSPNWYRISSINCFLERTNTWSVPTRWDEQTWVEFIFACFCRLPPSIWMYLGRGTTYRCGRSRWDGSTFVMWRMRCWQEWRRQSSSRVHGSIIFTARLRPSHNVPNASKHFLSETCPTPDFFKPLYLR